MPGQQYYAGLDLAKVEDYTVPVVMNSKAEVVYADHFNRLDWSIQVTRVSAAVERYNHALTLCDTTGVGEPVYEALRKAGVPVKAYPFTSRSKTELVNNLALMVEQRRITLPRPELWPEGIEELEAFEYTVTEAGTVKSSAPSGLHDDCVMAVGLAARKLGRGVGGMRFYRL